MNIRAIADHVGHALLAFMAGMMLGVALEASANESLHESVHILVVVFVVLSYAHLIKNMFVEYFQWRPHNGRNHLLAIVFMSIPLLAIKLLS